MSRLRGLWSGRSGAAIALAGTTGVLVAAETAVLAMALLWPLGMMLGLPATVLPFELALSGAAGLACGAVLARSAYRAEMALGEPEPTGG
jgi:hypothetical protein